MTGIKIISTGRALPENLVTNDDLSEIVDTSDEWIKTRTGIETRYFSKKENNWELAAEAAKKAVEKAGIDKNEIGACIVATFTPDYSMPSVACLVHRELGLKNQIPAFDINAACSGFVYGLKIAQSLMIEMKEKYVLLIGSEVVSRVLDLSDRKTCVLFGDGAGAVLIEKNPERNFYCSLGAEGNYEALSCGGAYEDNPSVKMDGTKVFKFAVDAVAKGIDEMLVMSGENIEDIDYIVCHQANKRILDFVGRSMKIPKEKMFMNLQRYANTVGATIPLALDEMAENDMLKPGTKIISIGFGAGYTWGSTLLEF